MSRISLTSTDGGCAYSIQLLCLWEQSHLLSEAFTVALRINVFHQTFVSSVILMLEPPQMSPVILGLLWFVTFTSPFSASSFNPFSHFSTFCLIIQQNSKVSGVPWPPKSFENYHNFIFQLNSTSYINDTNVIEYLR